ncbi:hypothetical protein LC048_15940 [Mesobacillus subterraneus]|nr:hypothetical protein [Mesobacillus subterraneus]WLR53978.1 hypothetical protein LC048_15940 [Mesobacillus subterraneus]
MTSPERTEATRGARRWSWTIRKAQAPWSAPTSAAAEQSEN